MERRTDRLDGWKSIAAYLGRDRSTVIRWANERGMPIHALPGGKARTVYADRAELDAWMQGGGDAAAAPLPGVSSADEPVADRLAPVGPITPASIEPAEPASSPRWRQARWLLIVIAGIALLGGGAAAYRWHGARTAASGLDGAGETQLLAARDDIASRSAPRLRTAIAALRTLRERQPANADVHESLAEAYLLAREFGSLPDALALTQARGEAETALRLDSESTVALRVEGVITYWWDRDPRTAGGLFRRAIALDPRDALAHQWYANILADNGEHRAAGREFDRARRLNPGAPYLLADYAWGLWAAGQEDRASAILNELARTNPELASAYDCLSVIAFARRDFAGYARQLARRAATRDAAEIAAYSRLVTEATTSGDERELYDVMLGRALAQAEGASRSDHSWPAFIASTFADRAQLLDILRRAGQRGEHWGAAAYTMRIARRWPGDAAVRAALARLDQPPIEPAS